MLSPKVFLLTTVYFNVLVLQEDKGLGDHEVAPVGIIKKPRVLFLTWHHLSQLQLPDWLYFCITKETKKSGLSIGGKMERNKRQTPGQKSQGLRWEYGVKFPSLFYVSEFMLTSLLECGTLCLEVKGLCSNWGTSFDAWYDGKNGRFESDNHVSHFTSILYIWLNFSSIMWKY